MDGDVGSRLRALRIDRGCSLSDLARRSGIGKGTISELENNRRGARLDTLFALTRALNAPLGSVLADKAEGDSAIHGDSVDATLIDRFDAGRVLVGVYRASIRVTVQQSAAHAEGVEETLIVIDGRVIAGNDRHELAAGESHRYRGDEPHSFRAVGRTATALILMHYPLPHTPTELRVPHELRTTTRGEPVTEPRLPERTRLIQEHLTRAGITAPIRELPESTRTASAAADALGCDIGAIASSLLFLAGDEPVLVMTSGRNRVDPELVAAALGVAHLRLAPAKHVRAVTGQAIGGVAPTGHPTPIRTVIDEALQQHSTIWAAAGTPHTVMSLTFPDLVALTHGAPIAVAPE